MARQMPAGQSRGWGDLPAISPPQTPPTRVWGLLTENGRWGAPPQGKRAVGAGGRGGPEAGEMARQMPAGQSRGWRGAGTTSGARHRHHGLRSPGRRSLAHVEVSLRRRGGRGPGSRDR